MVNGVDFIPERDMELYEAYRRALKMREVKSHREAVMRAISSHASRFWISTLQAYRGILLIRKGKTKEKGRSIRNKMIDDIYEIYKELEKKREFKTLCIKLYNSREAPFISSPLSRSIKRPPVFTYPIHGRWR